MSKRIIFILIIIGLIALVYFNVINWQPLTMIVAALTAPFKFVSGLFKNREEEIRERHQLLREQESAYQQTLESNISEREQKIATLNKEVEILDSKLDMLRKKRELVDTEVEKMSLGKLQKEGRRLFGSKKRG
jgi:septal ring factor EnvC (AmiA/AmiB activator)